MARLLEEQRESKWFSVDPNAPLPPWTSNVRKPWCFGNPTWEFIQRACMQFPEKPTDEQRKSKRQLLRRVIEDLPCTSCRTHASAYWEHTPPDLRSQRTLFTWAWAFHNTVNARLNKEPVHFDEALRLTASPVVRQQGVYADNIPYHERPSMPNNKKARQEHAAVPQQTDEDDDSTLGNDEQTTFNPSSVPIVNNNNNNTVPITITTAARSNPLERIESQDVICNSLNKDSVLMTKVRPDEFDEFDNEFVSQEDSDVNPTTLFGSRWGLMEWMLVGFAAFGAMCLLVLIVMPLIRSSAKRGVPSQRIDVLALEDQRDSIYKPDDFRNTLVRGGSSDIDRTFTVDPFAVYGQ